ncbi:glycosyltransferase family 25 protein [Xenorhabdus sp. TS4]|uniref:glycosyltransferase family 25 protein n=1 Tax=Xenorhabdus sp. TS4 TaxID=1873483 RepID=UPI001656B442|nr:glycosyltransferase family 25 protein [Xenorhabdus sp. TS4]MBC8950099.1 lipooligosaccharide galactosyltransferase I [Xenorhabdus sp. TS4]
MKVFVINLEKDTNRRKNIQREIEKFKLNNVEFISAVNGYTLTDNQLMDSVFNYPECQLTKGEIGCALSHLKIYKRIVDEKIPLALILEDDALLSLKINKVISEIKDFDNCNVPNVYLLNKAKSYIKNKKIESNNLSFYSIYEASYAYGYVVNYQAAQNLIDNMSPIRFEADMWGIFRILNIANIYCLLNPVIHNGDASCVTSSIEEDRQKNTSLRPKQRSKAKKTYRHYHIYKMKEFLNKKFIFDIQKA